MGKSKCVRSAAVFRTVNLKGPGSNPYSTRFCLLQNCAMSIVFDTAEHASFAFAQKLWRVRLLLYWPPEAQHISIVVDDLKGPEPIVGIRQLAMHGNLPAGELFVQCVGIICVDVCVPAGPFMARMVRLRMDLWRDRLEVQHHPVASNDGEEDRSDSVAASLVANVEPQLGLVENNRGVEVVDNKEGSNAV